MRELAKRGINELHVEAGFKLNGSLLREGWSTSWCCIWRRACLAMRRAGCSICRRWSDLAEKRTLQWRDVRQVGGDLAWVARLPAPHTGQPGSRLNFTLRHSMDRPSSSSSPADRRLAASCHQLQCLRHTASHR